MKLICENKNCEYYNKSESEGASFIAVLKYTEIHDFEVTSDGKVGTDLTIQENEDLHREVVVRAVKCRHCDEDVYVEGVGSVDFKKSVTESALEQF